MDLYPQYSQYDPVPIRYRVKFASPHSGSYEADRIIADLPDDDTSRWSSAQNARVNQWLMLQLEAPTILKRITFGKFKKRHPCTVKEVKVYAGMDEDTMSEVLHAHVQEDPTPETFLLKHQNEHGHQFTCRFVKIVPLSPQDPKYNIAIWHVALYGVKDPDAIKQVAEAYERYQEFTVLKHILRHLRQRRLFTPYQAILTRTQIELEDPLVTELHTKTVIEGDWSKAEAIMKTLSSGGHFSEYLHQSEPKTIWTYLNDGGESPVGRAGHAMCIDSARGVLYLHGGWDGKKCLDDFWCYDLDTGRWKLISPSTAGDKNGPIARSCHQMIFDPHNGHIYLLGRLGETGQSQKSTPTPNQMHTTSEQNANGASEYMPDTSSPCSEFYRYNTKGIDAGTWQLMTFDTKTLGGPPLIYDTQMVIDEDSHTIHVIGGRLVHPSDDAGKYAGIYSFDIRSNRWASHDLSKHAALPRRSGHSAVFDRRLRSIFVFGGKRDELYLEDMFTYDVHTNMVTVLHSNTCKDPSELAKTFGRKSVIDVEMREIYSFGGITAHGKDEVKILDDCLVYRYDSKKPGKWVPLAPCSPPETGQGRKEAEEPTQRFAHELVFDSRNKTAFLFGGNSGESLLAEAHPAKGIRSQPDPTRLDDFWSMRIVRLTNDDILRQVAFRIRCQQFREMCGNHDSVQTLEFLQTQVSSVVDHNDAAEEKHFRSLLTHLLVAPSSEDDDQDADGMTQSSENWTDSLDGSSFFMEDPRTTQDPMEKSRSARDDDRFAQRNQLFETLLQFLNEDIKQPSGNLLELVDQGHGGL